MPRCRIHFQDAFLPQRPAHRSAAAPLLSSKFFVAYPDRSVDVPGPGNDMRAHSSVGVIGRIIGIRHVRDCSAIFAEGEIRGARATNIRMIRSLRRWKTHFQIRHLLAISARRPGNKRVSPEIRSIGAWTLGCTIIVSSVCFFISQEIVRPLLLGERAPPPLFHAFRNTPISTHCTCRGGSGPWRSRTPNSQRNACHARAWALCGVDMQTRGEACSGCD